MTFQHLAATAPDGKDYLLLLAGFLLGYIGSNINSRYDRFRALRIEAARLMLVMHYHVDHAGNGIEAFCTPRSQLNAVSNELMLEGHTAAHAHIERTINALAQVVKRNGERTSALPANHPLLTSLAPWTRDRIGIHHAMLEILQSREAIAAEAMKTSPDFRVFLPFGLRWLGPIIDEIETLIKWC